jgi:subtilisin-like proprotein convertase family protein/uncharacterized protein YvpB
MSGKKDGAANLYISVILAIFMLLLLSIRGFAGTSIKTLPVYSGTNTPTDISSYTYQINQDSPHNPSLTAEVISTGLLTPTPFITYSFILTETLTITSTDTVTPTDTPTPSPTPTETPTSRPTSYSVLPFLYNVHNIPILTPSPLDTVLFCDNLSEPVPIPDNLPNGMDDYISISEGRLLINLSLYLDISHSAVGNLVVKLTNQNTNKTITVLDRPGNQNSHCSENDIVAILDGGAAQSVNEQCAPESPAISGIYLPGQSLKVFSRVIPSGIWQLNISDQESSNIGSLNHWCLEAQLSNLIPLPSPTPTPVWLPSSAYVSGMSGQDQQLNLDCESRSAVDWARYYGFNIDELDFLYNLTGSDDPETGFVGDPDGTWGFMPPDDYGVHAPPIATLLADYGLSATSYRSLRWDDIRAEISSGNPAIVWIIGGYSYNLVNGIPHFYTASFTGNTTIVAPHEHTVIVVGYSPSDVTVLNGSRFINVPLDQFLEELIQRNINKP